MAAMMLVTLAAASVLAASALVPSQSAYVNQLRAKEAHEKAIAAKHPKMFPTPAEADTKTILRFVKLIRAKGEKRAVGEDKPVAAPLADIFSNAPGPSEGEETSQFDAPVAEQTEAEKADAELKAAKCDQACTDGSVQERKACNSNCAKLQRKVCASGFSCTSGCGNDVKQLKKDRNCEELCDSVHAAICLPFKYEADEGSVSPHHDDHEDLPSAKATPPMRVYTGKTVFCNLYPAVYNFEVLVMDSPDDQANAPVATLAYKQCDELELKTGQVIGLRVKDKMAGVSHRIDKIPSIMVVGQWAHGNLQVNFNRYFVKSSGPFVCNGFPLWEKDADVGEEVQVYRGVYKTGAELAPLRYKECTASSLRPGSVVSVMIKGKESGQYTLTERPKVIVLGKAGQTSAVAFEAWSTESYTSQQDVPAADEHVLDVATIDKIDTDLPR